jgi:hypothetical protein
MVLPPGNFLPGLGVHLTLLLAGTFWTKSNTAVQAVQCAVCSVQCAVYSMQYAV